MKFNEAKQKKERGLSVKEAIEEINEKQNDYKDVLIVAVTEDKAIDISYSVDDTVKAIGFLEIVKQSMLDETFYGEE